MQNERLREIEKLTLSSWKGIKEFSQHYLYNATTAKQGYNKGIVEIYFNKLPDPLGSMIFEEYKKESEGMDVNISQAITFVFKQLRKICTSIQAQRSMKKSDYNFCNNIIKIPMTYGDREYGHKKKQYKPYKGSSNFKTKKRYFLRRSDNRAPFLHKRNVTRYNPRKNYDKTCRCFICNSPDHLSKTCPNKGQKRYSSKYEEQEIVLIVDSVNENILVCDDEIKDDESIYSIIETDEVENEELENSSSEEEIDLIEELAGLKIEMMNQVELKHEEQMLPNKVALLAFENDQKEDKINISKYIIKIPIKDMLGIKNPIIINLKQNLSYQLLALLDTGCTKNIIHSKYFERCP